MLLQRSIIVGDDGSEEARRAGELAAGIGKLLDARVLLLRVYPSVTVFKANRVVHVRASKEVLTAIYIRVDPYGSL